MTELQLTLSPEQSADNQFIKKQIAKNLDIKTNDISKFKIIRKSIDARVVSQDALAIGQVLLEQADGLLEPARVPVGASEAAPRDQGNISFASVILLFFNN